MGNLHVFQPKVWKNTDVGNSGLKELCVGGASGLKVLYGTRLVEEIQKITTLCRQIKESCSVKRTKNLIV